MEIKYTPMINQYLQVKKQHQDKIVFYRLGDFYEMFFEDAKIASNILDLVLTARGKNENAVPMCGIPFHSAKSYIQKLVNNGYSVAIVEQLEEAVAGKIVERDVVKIITPGTILNDEETKEVNYLLSIYDTKFSFILLYLDHFSGEMFVREIQRDITVLTTYLDSNIKEIIIRKHFEHKQYLKNIPVTIVDHILDISEYQYLNTFSDVGIIQAFELLMQYLKYTQKTKIAHLQPLYKIDDNHYLAMDVATKHNLELITSTKNKKYSLWGYLDRCVTVGGSRKLMKWIEYPLVNVTQINQRLEVVGKLKDDIYVKNVLKEMLRDVFDLQRLYSKIAYENISPKELLKLQITLNKAPEILALFKTIKDYQHVSVCSEIANLLNEALLPEVSTNIKDGNVFKSEFNDELKTYRHLQQEGGKYILALEQQEREKTGIKNLKIAYTRAFGYYIEISKGQIENIKDEFGYIRRQTLTTGERYISLELKEIEEKLLHAKEKILEIELKLFSELLHEIKKYQQEIKILADTLSEIDCYLALSEVSSQYGYIKPEFTQKTKIVEGRHPILESLMTKGQYISNDFENNQEIMILTGPNMGGKSTYMRQIALIVLMAQIGCYVPAKQAELKLFTKIFTRMGASDDILSAQSTFMVEMSEANNALRHADSQSLILFDEIGRGTSTYDGMSLAWAMIEYIQKNIKATTIFSTHYHELTQLATLEQVANYYVEVEEEKDHITFLYKVKPGFMNKSYGINVAQLAKLPDFIIERSKEVIKTLGSYQTASIPETNLVVQNHTSKVTQLIQNANVDAMTPLEALLFVVKLKEEVDNE